jgi:hypothetical protein
MTDVLKGGAARLRRVIFERATLLLRLEDGPYLDLIIRSIEGDHMATVTASGASYDEG